MKQQQPREPNRMTREHRPNVVDVVRPHPPIVESERRADPLAGQSGDTLRRLGAATLQRRAGLLRDLVELHGCALLVQRYIREGERACSHDAACKAIDYIEHELNRLAEYPKA